MLLPKGGEFFHDFGMIGGEVRGFANVVGEIDEEEFFVVGGEFGDALGGDVFVGIADEFPIAFADGPLCFRGVFAHVPIEIFMG